MICQVCDGTGTVPNTNFLHGTQIVDPCPNCKGTGQLPDSLAPTDTNTCPLVECNGTCEQCGNIFRKGNRGMTRNWPF